MLTGNFHEIPGHFLWLLKNSCVIFSKKISATIKTSFDFCFGRRWVVLWLDVVVNPAFIIMKFVRAAREVDWPLHLVALKAMLPYFRSWALKLSKIWSIELDQDVTTSVKSNEKKYSAVSMQRVINLDGGMPSGKI